MPLISDSLQEIELTYPYPCIETEMDDLGLILRHLPRYLERIVIIGFGNKSTNHAAIRQDLYEAVSDLKHLASFVFHLFRLHLAILVPLSLAPRLEGIDLFLENDPAGMPTLPPVAFPSLQSATIHGDEHVLKSTVELLCDHAPKLASLTVYVSARVGSTNILDITQAVHRGLGHCIVEFRAFAWPPQSAEVLEPLFDCHELVSVRVLIREDERRRVDKERIASAWPRINTYSFSSRG
jgi:hypothetical protein